MRSRIRILLVAACSLSGFMPARAARAEDSSEPSSSEDPPRAPQVSRPTVRFFAVGGVSYGELFALGVRTTRVEAGFAVRISPRLAVSIAFAHEFGSTSTELATHETELSGVAELIYGRLRVGLGPHLSYFKMDRASTSTIAHPIDAIGLGLRAPLSVDVVRLGEDRAFFLRGSPEITWLRGPSDLLVFDRGALAWGLSVAGGFRF